MEQLRLEARLTIDAETPKATNLATRFGKDDLQAIGRFVWDGYDRDKKSRVVFEKRMEAAMDLALQIVKEKNFPWPGSSNVVFPLVTIATLQFSARSYENIVQGTDIVRYRVAGPDPDGKLKQRADRISRHMSWQVLEEDTAWEEQHDRLLINLGIVGTAFIKTYFSTRLGHNVSELVTARDLVIDYWAKDCNTAARKTQIIMFSRNDIYTRVKRGVFCDVLEEDWYVGNAPQPEGQPMVDNRTGQRPPLPEYDTPLRGLEQHCWLDLDGDGYSEPYVVTIDEQSKNVLRIKARWQTDFDVEREDSGAIIQITADEYFTKYGFIPSPDGGFYDIGFGILLGPLNESVNAGINQLIDAGTMANSNAGFLGRGAKIRSGKYTFAPWEWQRVDSTGDDIRKSLVQFPVREPSNVMLALLQLLIEYTAQISGTQEQMVGQNPGQNTPAETSRNTMEQGMRVYSSIFKRVWRSLKEEFQKLHALNRQYLDSMKNFGDTDQFQIQADDYKSRGDLVVPVADPRVTSKSQRQQQALMLDQMAMAHPGFAPDQVMKRVLAAFEVEGIEEIYPGPQKTGPLPNPKVQQEQMKQKGALDKAKLAAAAKLKQEQTKLQSEYEEKQAAIKLIEAQIYQIIMGVQNDQTGHRVEVFKQVMEGLQLEAQTKLEQAKAKTAEIKAIAAQQQAQQDSGGDSGGDQGQSGGMGQMDDGAGDAGVPGGAPAAGGGAGAPMG